MCAVGGPNDQTYAVDFSLRARLVLGRWPSGADEVCALALNINPEGLWDARIGLLSRGVTDCIAAEKCEIVHPEGSWDERRWLPFWSS